jgi:alanine-glyoxylate transaminase/serine-glyoxylate transaminase/serine-pyruvate transaminase
MWLLQNFYEKIQLTLFRRIENMAKVYKEIKPSMRTLMGPGPSDVDPRVLKAMATPLVGHLDPDFLAIMDASMDMLRRLFQTQNTLTIPISGTGSSGMEAALCNVIEEGDEVLVCVNGVFGQRMSDIVGRCRGKLAVVEADWGKIIPPEKVKSALEKSQPRIVAIVHAETSTGVLQPLGEIGEMVRESGALFLVDTVTSLAGAPVKVDEWNIDICYSGTQKCLSCPPGLAPITFSERAMDVIRNRKEKVQSWYLDMSMIERYWGSERVYHHTAPISMIYAFHEALRVIHEEGLENRFQRHSKNSAALAAGLKAMGLSLLAQEGYRAPMLTTVGIPEGITDLNVRKKLLNDYLIEIGGGLGDFKGTAWRIGLMGYSCTKRNVLCLLNALESILAEEGFNIERGVGVDAANQAFNG